MFGLRTRFTGHGTIQFEHSSEVFGADCKIRVEPFRRRPIKLATELTGDPFMFSIAEANSRTRRAVLRGQTDTGESIECHGMSTIDSNSLVFAATDLEIGTRRGFAHVRFYLGNVMAIPKPDRLQSSRKHAKGASPWSFDFPVQGSQIKASLKMRKDLANVSPDTDSDSPYRLAAVLDLFDSTGQMTWDLIEEPVYRFCNLLSMAQGRTINWVAARGSIKGEPDWWLYRHHSISPWWGKNRIIDMEKDPEAVRSLLNCVPRLLSLTDDEITAFRRALNLTLFSPRLYEFPVPFYVCGGALEVLYTTFCSGSGDVYISDKSLRNSVRDSFANWAESEFIPAVGVRADELRESLTQKFNGLNGRFLNGKIEALANRFGVSYDQAVLKEFVKQRNASTHGELKEKDLRTNLDLVRAAEDFLSTLLLRVIGYRGTYWLSENGFRTRFTME